MFRVYRPFTAFSVDDEPLYWVLNDLPLRLETIVRERLPAARFLDLTPALREAARRGALVYYAGRAPLRTGGGGEGCALTVPPLLR